MDQKRKHPRPTEKALANLKPIKKGEVRNPYGPQGRAGHEFRKLTSETLSEMIDIAMNGNLEDLQKIVNDPQSPVIKVGIAKVMYDAIKEGNWLKVEQLLARSIGKVPDKIDHTTNGQELNQNIQIEFISAASKKATTT